MSRWDETWHRLRLWTNGQAPSERLAAQILLHEKYEGLDPSHPLGGKDGTKDAICYKDDKKWVMAVYFPRDQQSLSEIECKFKEDAKGVTKNSADGIAFVTNQELRLRERDKLKELVSFPTHLYHLETITAILDKPDMAGIRKQYLDISTDLTESIFPDIHVSFRVGSGRQFSVNKTAMFCLSVEKPLQL